MMSNIHRVIVMNSYRQTDTVLECKLLIDWMHPTNSIKVVKELNESLLET